MHLPPAEAGPPSADFMALRRCSTFVDRNGKQHMGTGSLAMSTCGNAGFAGDEHAFTLYRVALDGGGAVTGAAPWAIIDETNLLRLFTNVSADGLVSAYTNGEYDLMPSIPIRIKLGAPDVVKVVDDGSTRYEVKASIENLSKGVKAADGTCMPSLASATGNPFPGAMSASLSFTRVSSMHAPGDDEAVFAITVDGQDKGSDMGPTWFVDPAALIVGTLRSVATYDGFGHGTPGYIPDFRLSLVQADGAPCP